MVAVSRCISAVFFAGIVLRSAAGAVCPTPGGNSWPDATMLRSMTCIHPAQVSGVPQSAGHFNLVGLDAISSKHGRCQNSDNEAKVLIAPGLGTMTLGSASCSLVSVGISRSDNTADFTAAVAEMRLDFDSCTAGPQRASVIMSVEKATDFLAPASSFPFMKTVCEPTVTTLAPSEAKVDMSFTQKLVGKGLCNGEVMDSYPGVDSHSCKEICIAEVQKFSGVTGLHNKTAKPNFCIGYAVNDLKTSGNVCHLYRGLPGAAIVNTSEAKETGWSCYDLKPSAAQHIELTTPAATAEDIADMEAHLPRLNINVAADAKTASVLTFNAPNNTCFTPFNVITLEDATFNPVTLKVTPSEWLSLLTMIPSSRRLKEAAAPVAEVSWVLADRVTYGDSMMPPVAAAGVAAPPPAAGAAAAPIESEAAPVEPACSPVPAQSSPVDMLMGVLNIFLIVCVAAAAYGGFSLGQKRAPAPKPQALE